MWLYFLLELGLEDFLLLRSLSFLRISWRASLAFATYSSRSIESCLNSLTTLMTLLRSMVLSPRLLGIIWFFGLFKCVLLIVMALLMLVPSPGSVEDCRELI